MGDQKHRRHRRHRSTIGHFVGGIGNNLAVALQTAGHVVDHSLKSTDDIVKAALTGSHRNHHPNHSSCQELYPRQQYHHQHQYKPEPANTLASPPSYKLSEPPIPNVSTAYYNEPPPAYSKEPPAYYYSDSPPAYSGLPPPPYTASAPTLATGALSVVSTEHAPAYTREKSVYGTSSTVDTIKVPAYSGSVLVRPQSPNFYVKPTPTRSPLVHGEAVPVYGFPPCYHYKYTDGCKYCLKWKWS